jgi:hypothetical protein
MLSGTLGEYKGHKKSPQVPVLDAIFYNNTMPMMTKLKFRKINFLAKVMSRGRTKTESRLLNLFICHF